MIDHYHFTPVIPTANPVFTGTVAVPAGSIAAPGVAVGGDPDTGIAQTAADTLSFVAGGTEWLRVGGAGAGFLTGQVRIPDGSVGAPGLRVTSSSVTGLYSMADNSVRFAVLGAQRAALTNDGSVSLSGGPGAEALRTVAVATAVNRWQASGAAAGATVVLEAAGSDGNVRAQVRGKGTGGLQLEAAGGAVGFYGAAPVTRRTVGGSRGSGAALADLLAALAALGLITDSTTA
ncbi:MAG TPA: hypothetical protein VGE72_06720 [Azospirillum sp.]